MFKTNRAKEKDRLMTCISRSVMNSIHVTTSTGETYQIPIENIEQDTVKYPREWRTSPSPSNFPSTDASHVSAGSTVNYPFQEMPRESVPEMFQSDRSVAYLVERENIDYSVIPEIDYDESCHVGTQGFPSAHWNFKVKQTIKYVDECGNHKEKTKFYDVEHKKSTNVPKCEWIEIELEINGTRFGKREFFWTCMND